MEAIYEINGEKYKVQATKVQDEVLPEVVETDCANCEFKEECDALPLENEELSVIEVTDTECPIEIVNASGKDFIMFNVNYLPSGMDMNQWMSFYTKGVLFVEY